MSSELHHVATNGQRTQLARRFSGHVHVNLSELDTDEHADILRMLADIARDPDAHFHEWGDPVSDARAALRLLELFLAGVDLARLAADVEALRGRVGDASSAHPDRIPAPRSPVDSSGRVCPDPGHINMWHCDTCDAGVAVAPATRVEPVADLQDDDGEWIHDPDMGAR